MLTDGIILEIEPENHSQGGQTIINIREDFTNPVTEQEHADSLEGWNAALSAVKEIAEK